MSRYIDIEPYEEDGWYLQKRYRNSYGEVIKTTPLASVPTADIEGKNDILKGELVRCKDCKYHQDEEPGLVYCPNIVGGWVSNIFYCGYGERWTGERNDI